MIMFPPQKNQPKLRFSLGPAEWQKLTLTAQVLLAEVHEVYVSTQIITFKRLLQFRILKKKSHPKIQKSVTYWYKNFSFVRMHRKTKNHPRYIFEKEDIRRE